jgi:hypothetical protein
MIRKYNVLDNTVQHEQLSSCAANDFIQVNCRPVILFFLHIHHRTMGKSADYGIWAPHTTKAEAYDNTETPPAHIRDIIIQKSELCQFVNKW